MYKLKNIFFLIILSTVFVFSACTNSAGASDSESETKTTSDKPKQPQYKVVDTEEINGVTYDIVEFGSFPQSQIEDGVTVDENEFKDAGLYTYYKGSDGEWYAAAKDSYYKVEPIRWRVLTTKYDHDKDDNVSTSGKKLLLAENIIGRERYDGESNNYEKSEIRKWLIENFYPAAFTGDEKNAIAETKIIDYTVVNDIYSYVETYVIDKVFLMTYFELTDSSYGFTDYAATGKDNTRNRKVSDFACANGAWVDTRDDYSGNGNWWWRCSVSNGQTSALCVCSDGSLGGDAGITNWSVGVVPALCLE